MSLSGTKSELGIQCLTLQLQDYTQNQIAIKLNIGRSTVHRQITKITKSREFQMGVITINEFFETFKKCEQYWDQSNRDYRELIDQVKEMENEDEFNESSSENGSSQSYHNSKFDKMITKIELISKLKDKQDKNMERILNLAKQGEVVLALKAARDILEEHAPSKPFILKKVDTIDTVKDTSILTKFKQEDFKETTKEESD